MNQRTPDGKEVREFLGTFIQLYAAHRNGATYFVRRPKDPVLVKQLLTCYTPQRLTDLARELLTTREEWISRTDRGIGILLVKASWLDGVLSERAAQQVQQLPAFYSGWMRECLQQHDNACKDFQAHVKRIRQEAIH